MRLALQPRTEMTLRTLAVLGGGGRWRAVDLAERVGTGAAFAAHLVGPLTRAGWVRSVPGPSGGHELAVDLRDLSLFDVIEAVEGATSDGRCVMANQPCPEAGCAVHEAWMRARDDLVAALRAISIRDVVAEGVAASTLKEES